MFHSLGRSADLQSAVSRNCILPGDRIPGGAGEFIGSADCKSAIQPIENLRYFAIALIVSWVLTSLTGAQAATVSVIPDADAFVRSTAPASNYGAGGVLSVSGLSAVNGSNQQMGSFDTFMRFPASNIVASLDAAFGPSGWVITAANLVVTETAAPDNAIFNRGIGAFEVRWLDSDNWVEGTGKPMAPASDGVAWQDNPGILNSNVDASLGVFTNSGANQQLALPLLLADHLIADIRSGSDVGLYLTAANASVGFTFNSRDFGNTNAQPQLQIIAAANPLPRIDSLASSNGAAVLGFDTAANWKYVLQGTANLKGPWITLLVAPAQATNSHIIFQEPATDRQRFYRLSVWR